MSQMSNCSKTICMFYESWHKQSCWNCCEKKSCWNYITFLMETGLKKYWVSISYQITNSIDNWSIDCQTIVYQLNLIINFIHWTSHISLVKLCFQLSFLLEKCICLFYKRKQSRVKFILSTIFLNYLQTLLANSCWDVMFRLLLQTKW